MATASEFCFADYRLNLANEQLWCGVQTVPLTTKALHVLGLLVAHAGQLVTKDALFAAVWPGAAVSEGVLSNCIGELRKALGDSAQAPRCLQTVHRRGYRFLAPVTTPAPPAPPPAGPWLSTAPVPPCAPLLVGRDAEVATLHQHLAQAQRGQRQVVLVSGEAGIGKTTVVDAFLATLAPDVPLWVAWGQCLAHYGPGEAYLPVLDALGRLGRAPASAPLLPLLRQYAPTWVGQLPALFPAPDREVGLPPVPGATRERMLREAAECLEALSAVQPLVLVLEDLHWSDHATLDLLTWLARRREPARLLVLGTYRPVEVIVHGHPLQAVKQELSLHGQCIELRLEGWDEAAVTAYLTARCPGPTVAAHLARVLHRRTEGQPLFIVQTVDAWVQQGWVAEVGGQWAVQVALATVETGVAESVRQMIAQQCDGLPPAAQGVLEAASVVGAIFSTAAVAAGLASTPEAVEAQCVALGRRGQFVRACGVEAWPDGTVAGQYAFVHALHQQVVYERLAVEQRLRLHRQIGRRLEAGYGAQADAQAAALAMHFDQGRDTPRAVRYRQQAATQALGRSAYQEAIGHLTRGLALLQTLPDTPERAQQELDLQLTLAPALIATRGQAAPEVEQTYARAWVLCTQIGETPQRFPTLWGLCLCYRSQGTLRKTRDVAEQLVRLAQGAADPTHLQGAHEALGATLGWMGDYATARRHLEQGSARLALPAARAQASRLGVSAAVRCLAQEALVLWGLGYPEQAVRRSQAAQTQAQALAHPYSLAHVQHFAAWLAYRRREVRGVQAQAEALLRLATTQAFPLFVGCGLGWGGWVLARQGQGEAGLAQLHQGLAAMVATGHEQSRPPWLMLLAEVAGDAGQVEEGLRLLAEALAACAASERGDILAEGYRLQGALLLRQATPDTAQAEACFHHALAIARRQQAKSWELRAALSLSRLWQQQGKHAEASALLVPIYGWFTEGFDTPDLQDAQALVADLGG